MNRIRISGKEKKKGKISRGADEDDLGCDSSEHVPDIIEHPLVSLLYKLE